MKIALLELRDNIARYFGYVPRSILEDKLVSVGKHTQTLLHNIDLVNQQKKLLDDQHEVQTRFVNLVPSIDAVYLVVDYDGKKKQWLRLYITGTRYTDKRGLTRRFEQNDVVLKNSFRVNLHKKRYTIANYVELETLANEISYKFDCKVILKDARNLEQEKIVAVAIRVGTAVYSMPKPYRHNDIFKMLSDTEINYLGKEVQGFLTNRNAFVDRREALVIAKAAKQLLPRHVNIHELFSESVW